jgi:hypothetical protein
MSRSSCCPSNFSFAFLASLREIYQCGADPCVRPGVRKYGYAINSTTVFFLRTDQNASLALEA